MPGVKFAFGVPAGDVDVVHAAVVERGAFGFMAFGGHVAGGHVADADDGEVADFAGGDVLLDFFVVPGVAVEHVDGDEAVGFFDFLDEGPFGFDVGGERFFGEDVFVVLEGAAEEIGAGVGEGEEADDFEGWVGEDLLGVGGYEGFGEELAGLFTGGGVEVADGGDFPGGVGHHGGDEAVAHASEADDSDAVAFGHVGGTFVNHGEYGDHGGGD